MHPQLSQLLRCSQCRSFTASATQAARAKPPSRHKTPPSPNPPDYSKPKRDRTTYGIPPLRPPPSRLEVEAAQRPDFEKLYDLEQAVAAAISKSAAWGTAKKALDIYKEKNPLPKRHALWAFFRDRRVTPSRSPPEGDAANSLADALEVPDRRIDQLGRSWTAMELRGKPFSELHQLWYTLAIERNRLYTQKLLLQKVSENAIMSTFVQENLQIVRKSMGKIKFVLAERRKAALQAKEILSRPSPVVVEEEVHRESMHASP